MIFIHYTARTDDERIIDSKVLHYKSIRTYDDIVFLQRRLETLYGYTSGTCKIINWQRMDSHHGDR